MISSHPLFILLLGILLGSVLIPYITDISTRNRLEKEAKQKKAFDIFKNNLDVTEQLYTLQKTLELFHYEFRHINPNRKNYSIIKEDQKELHKRLHTLYLEFDRHAWWWYWDIYHEAEILDLISEAESERLKKLFDRYKNNLLESLKTLDPLWFACIDENYDPTNAKIIEIINSTSAKLDSLTSSRTEVIREFASSFVTKDNRRK